MMPFSDPRKTTVWFLCGPASLSTTMRVRRYLGEINLYSSAHALSGSDLLGHIYDKNLT